MTRPIARVLALLEILQGGGVHKVAALAARLDVDERTVRRYVEHLLDLGIPVESQRGRYGGLRLGAGFRLPPLMLTDDEALAVLVDLSSRTGGAPEVHRAGALGKILRVLPAASRVRFEALLAAVDLAGAGRGGGAQPGADPATDTDILLTVAEAAGARVPLLLHYADRQGRGSRRMVLPYGLVARSGRWYLSGADSLSGEVRTFRVDRIRSADPQDGAFEVPAGFDPAGSVGSALATTPWRHAVSVRVEASAEHVRERLPDGLATIIELPPAEAPTPGTGFEGWSRVEFRAERLTWVPALLASLDRPFVVDQPVELRDAVRALGERLIAIAGGD